MGFVLDENISPLVSQELRALGYDLLHVREVGLKGCSDEELISWAKKEKRALITLDADFSDIRRFPLGSHSGIIRLKLRFAPSWVVINCLKKLLKELQHVAWDSGVLVVTNCRKYRIRYPK